MDQIFANQKYITCTVDRIEGNFAVLKTDDGQTINWPADKLSGDASEGSTVRLILSTSKTDEEEREKTAKAVLNQILKTE